MKLLVTIAVYISPRRGGSPVATLHTYIPRCPTDLERFFRQSRQSRRRFSKSPRKRRTRKTFPFLPAGLAALAGVAF
jgi:hypothetical protein